MYEGKLIDILVNEKQMTQPQYPKKDSITPTIDLRFYWPSRKIKKHLARPPGPTQDIILFVIPHPQIHLAFSLCNYYKTNKI